MSAQSDRRLPPGVEVALTTVCNLRCSYCFQHRGEARRMPWSVLRAALDLVLASGAAKPELSFTGGEPLLELGLIRRAIAYLDGRSSPGTRVRLRMTTNGTMLGARAIRLLAPRRVRTYISFDGVAPAQDLRGERSFAQLDALLGRLRRDWPGWLADDVTVGMTLSSANLDHLAASVRYFLARAVPSFVISPLVTHDPGWDDGCVARLDAQLSEASDALNEHRQRTGEQPCLNFVRGSGPIPHRRREVSMCRIGSHGIFVDVDGEAVLCGLLSRSFAKAPTDLASRAARAARLGPVTDRELPLRLAAGRGALAELRLFDGKERKRSRYRACSHCPAWSRCQVCPLSIANQPGNDDPDAIPPLPCAFNLLVAKHWRRLERRRRLETAAALGGSRRH